VVNLVKVSVIIPTYNRAHVIGRSIQSALDQTYRDFEILVVDDGSTDETLEAVEPFFQHAQVRYLRHERNKGHQAARNTGVKNARGEYIAFLDSDDTWLPEKIELQLEAIKAKGADRVVVTWIQKIENGKRAQFFERQYEGYVYPEVLAGDGPGSYGCMLLPREWFVQIGFADEDIPAAADWDTFISLSKLFEFTTVNKVCVNYYQDEKKRVQDCGSSTARGYYAVVKKRRNDMLRVIGRHGLARHYVRIALSFDDAGDFGRCRRCMLKAFRCYGRDPTIFFLAFTTLLGKRTFHLRKPVSRIKGRLTKFSPRSVRTVSEGE